MTPALLVALLAAAAVAVFIGWGLASRQIGRASWRERV